MPKREDELYLKMKEELKEEPKCPFCGSENISYNKFFGSWKCNSCEGSFKYPVRSY